MTNKVTMEKARKNLIEFLEIYYFYSFWFHVNALFPLFLSFFSFIKFSKKKMYLLIFYNQSTFLSQIFLELIYE